MKTEDEGFLSRWSRRKQAGNAPTSGTAPAVPVAAPPAVAAPPVVARAANAEADAPGTSAGIHTAPAAPQAPPPTLEDVADLTRDSAYGRFVAREVDPEVRNAALRKLFTDPHFNVMDGLDIYIDDYGKPDPIPASMLREMVQARALGLWDDEDKAEADGQGGTADASRAAEAADAAEAAEAPDPADVTTAAVTAESTPPPGPVTPAPPDPTEAPAPHPPTDTA